MPEMPEVEVMVKRLQRFVGHFIVSSDSRHKRYLPTPEWMIICSQTIRGIFRRGKYIIFMLDDGAILCHNAMSGFWDSDDDRWTFDYVEGKRVSKDSDIRSCLLVSKQGEPLNRGVNLLFHDSRKFGSLRYLEPEELTSKLSQLGPEIVGTDNVYEPRVLSKSEFYLLCKTSQRQIKELLMDQSKIAGVGNIYAAEACHRARISPFRVAHDLSDSECDALFDSTKVVLSEALSRNLDYSKLGVYHRKYCSVCTGPVSVMKQKGRTTHWCSKCQK